MFIKDKDLTERDHVMISRGLMKAIGLLEQESETAMDEDFRILTRAAHEHLNKADELHKAQQTEPEKSES